MPNGDRIGITNTARILNVSVTELKNAIFQGDNKLHGIELPKVINLTGGNYQFRTKDVLELKAKLDNNQFK